MSFLRVPNLPEARIVLAAVDGRISAHAEGTLSSLGIEIIKTCRHTGVYEAIAFHPDIMLHHLGGDAFVYAPGTDLRLLGSLAERGFRLIRGDTVPAGLYPGDISYNVARVGDCYFHNLKYTDPVLKKELEDRGIEPVHVNQGYAKCSISIVDNNSIITSDTGIAKAAEAKGIEALIVNSRQNILLPGLDYGFIGGSSCLLSPDEWAVNGDAGSLSSFEEISQFLARKNKKIVSLSEEQVTDIGSILPLLTEAN